MSVSPQPSGPTTAVVSPHNIARSPPTQGGSNNTDVSPTSGGQSNTQLAEMLHASFREVETLRMELNATKRRAEKSETVLSAIQSASGPGGPTSSQQALPEAALRVIMECEHRVQVAEQARDEAEVRRRVLMEAWTELDRYLGVIEIRAADARAGYSRIVAEGGGQLVLTNIPLPGQSAGPLNQHNTMPPPNHTSRTHHQRSQSQRSSIHPPSPWPSLPPHPTPNPGGHHGRVRPRSGSLDESGYSVGIPGQPPAKRPRGDRDTDERRARDDRASFSESPVESHRLPPMPQNIRDTRQQIAPNPTSIHTTTTSSLSQPAQHHASRTTIEYNKAREREEYQRVRLPKPGMDNVPAHYNQRQAPAQPHRPRGRSRSFSPRSPSQESNGSKDIDELLIEATTDDGERRFNRSPRQSTLHGHRGHPNDHPMPYRPDSPSSEYYGHPRAYSRTHGVSSLPHLDTHSPGGGPPGTSVITGPAMHSDASGSLSQPGQVLTYQTHIFAPPVTGAPVKKSKFLSASGAGSASVGANVASGSGSALAQAGPNGTIIPGPPPPISSGSYPPTNSQGQRICRQCGLPGRYKDGKCVEKWGPGPEGPGTVCDRCRKKMKRVERRGTLDGQQSNNNSSSSLPSGLSTHGSLISHSGLPARAPMSTHGDRSVQRTDTLPANHHTSSSRSGGAFGPAGTHLISPPSSFSRSERYREDSHSRPRSSAPPADRSPRGPPRSPPSPPAIATLSVAGEEVLDTKTGSSRNGNHSSRRASVDRRQSPTNGHSNKSHSSGGSVPPASEGNGVPARRSPLGSDHSMTTAPKRPSPTTVENDADADADPDADADADADAEAEADVDDADLELLEAVDAAEANSSSTDPTPKAEDEEEVDEMART